MSIDRRRFLTGVAAAAIAAPAVAILGRHAAGFPVAAVDLAAGSDITGLALVLPPKHPAWRIYTPNEIRRMMGCDHVLVSQHIPPSTATAKECRIPC